jgi:hypothetical protein
MSDQGPNPRASYLREGLLLFGFLAIVAVSVVTVALPELSDAEEREPSTTTAPAADQPDAG